MRDESKFAKYDYMEYNNNYDSSSSSEPSPPNFESEIQIQIQIQTRGCTSKQLETRIHRISRASIGLVLNTEYNGIMADVQTLPLLNSRSLVTGSSY